MRKTHVDIGGLIIRNPVMTASGTFGYGEEYAPYIDLRRLGAVIVKGLSLKPQPGNYPPRIIETPAGMLNAIGLENVGVERFITEKLPPLRDIDIPVIANIFGETVEDYMRVAEILSGAAGVSGLEINISCPNIKRGGIDFGTDPDLAYEVTHAVRTATHLPVIAKLTPNVTDVTVIARSVVDAGADAVSLINTLKGLSVDIATRRPHLRNITGGLSGPAVKTVALRMVWEVARSVSVPVIGLGGIMTAADALEFLIVGATAVQVGTASFIDPAATVNIVDGIDRYLEDHGIDDISDLIGSFRTN